MLISSPLQIITRCRRSPVIFARSASQLAFLQLGRKNETEEPDVAKLTYPMKQRSVQDLINRYDRRSLNLEPGFQRKSVWSLADCKKLIESIVHGYPVPTEFFSVVNASCPAPSSSGGAPA